MRNILPAINPAPVSRPSVNISRVPSSLPSKQMPLLCIDDIHVAPCLCTSFREHQLHEELARLHSSVSTFYLSVPNCLQYKKEIIGTMEQAVRYAQLAKNTTEYLSCLHDIAQVRSMQPGFAFVTTSQIFSRLDAPVVRRLSRREDVSPENLSIPKRQSNKGESNPRSRQW